MEKKYKAILKEYFPEKSVDPVYQQIMSYNVRLRITRKRKTKLGDYRPPIRHPFHQISINHDLNPYSFLITFVHELAHLVTWERYKNSVQPHGEEWSANYQKLMHPYIDMNVFPDDVKEALIKHLKSGRASSSGDFDLKIVLNRYDSHSSERVVADLIGNEVFQTLDGRRFRVIKKLRKRYECECLDNGKKYLVQPKTPIL